MCTGHSGQPPARPGDRQSGEKGRVGAGVGVWAPAGAGAGMQSLAPEPGFMLYGNEDIASIPSIKPSYLVSMIPAMAPPPSPGSWLPWSSVPVCRAGRGGPSGAAVAAWSRPGTLQQTLSIQDSSIPPTLHLYHTLHQVGIHCLLDLQYLQ